MPRCESQVKKIDQDHYFRVKKIIYRNTFWWNIKLQKYILIYYIFEEEEEDGEEERNENDLITAHIYIVE